MLPTVFCNLTILCMTHSKRWPLSWTEYNWWQSASFNFLPVFSLCCRHRTFLSVSPVLGSKCGWVTEIYFIKFERQYLSRGQLPAALGYWAGYESYNVGVTLWILEGDWRTKVVGFHRNVVEVLALIWQWILNFRLCMHARSQ